MLGISRLFVKYRIWGFFDCLSAIGLTVPNVKFTVGFLVVSYDFIRYFSKAFGTAKPTMENMNIITTFLPAVFWY